MIGYIWILAVYNYRKLIYNYAPFFRIEKCWLEPELLQI